MVPVPRPSSNLQKRCESYRMFAPRAVTKLLLLLLLPAALAAQQTRPERTNWAETSSYADVISFLDSLRLKGAEIRVGELGRSPEGKSIPYVLAPLPPRQRGADRGPDLQHRRQRSLGGGGGEPSGTEWSGDGRDAREWPGARPQSRLHQERGPRDPRRPGPRRGVGSRCLHGPPHHQRELPRVSPHLGAGAQSQLPARQ